MPKHILRRLFAPPVVVSLLLAMAARPRLLNGQEPASPPISFKVQRASERMEMTVNTSRILTLDQKIWKVQVNNREILEQTPLSPTQVSVFAKKPGVTQVYLFSEDQRVFSVDVMVLGDAQELATLLQAQFPNASLKVVPVSSNVLISGYVDHPDHAALIAQIAEQYYPKVINNMIISGVQQVLLHVKVMEVSRTKLRNLGFDFAKLTGNNLFASGASALLLSVDPQTAGNGLITNAGGHGVLTSTAETVGFRVVEGGGAFFGVLEALRQDSLMKIMAEPTIVAINGRSSKFHVGGTFYIVPQGLAAAPPRDIDFGTTLEFVPIVLGNGRIHLEVRPEVSEVDQSLNVGGIPGTRKRSVDTAVEMEAGQTLAIAGLVQSREEAQNRGLPWVSEVPYIGALFRRVHHERNEVELLILVTPELVEAMDAAEVPPCGPGLRTTTPSDFELYLQGHLEVPNCCPPGCSQAPEGQGVGGAMPPQEGMILEEDEPAAEAGQATVTKPAKWRNLYTPSKPPGQPADSPPAGQKGEQGFIGPTGYDVVE
jgi:pilus assembly protein CpaC